MTDISKKTILILLVLVIISSIISTWAFVSNVSAPQKVKLVSPRTSIAEGEVRLEIEAPRDSVTTADVILDIQKQ